MTIINNVITDKGKIRLWSNKSVISKKGGTEIKYKRKRAKEPERKCFYLYDENGKEIFESKRSFTARYEEKILDMKKRYCQ